MRRYRFLQFDVFTDTPFGGNQLAVLPDASGLSDAEMRAIAREMNYSESTFVLPAEAPDALRRVRIFTPATELPFAGHPTIGTTYALAASGILPADAPTVGLEMGVGTIRVDPRWADGRLQFAEMHQPIPRFEPWAGDRGRLAAALGLSSDDFAVDLPIERANVGVTHILIPLRSLDAVARAYPGADLLEALDTPGGHPGAYLFTTERPASGADIHGRMFAPAMNIAEDPATGSAVGPLGVYLLRHERLTPYALGESRGESRLRVEQGIEMGRPSDLRVSITGSTDDVRDVRVGGQSVLVAEGELLLP